MVANVPTLISQRASTHGPFDRSSATVQETKDLWRAAPNWERMHSWQRECLDMVAHKVGRILHGDPDYNDHWVDIQGYVARVLEYIDRLHPPPPPA